MGETPRLGSKAQIWSAGGRLRLAILAALGAESSRDKGCAPSSKSSYRGFPLKKCRDPITS